MGGEKSGAWWIIILFLGSPPHRRGKEYDDPTQNELIGITPAWAGKSCTALRRSARCGDHPRVGGEKCRILLGTGCKGGSPPRGRGKVHRCQIGPWPLGITPAWAGKSRCARLDAGHREDHPRVGGEKSSPRIAAVRPLGSPPRGRGKADPKRHRTRQAGITPAWAGKRVCRRLRSAVRRDHPRVGGEKRYYAPFKIAALGSPPRGRGKVRLFICFHFFG